MSCSPFDLRDYFLGELAVPEERVQVESHLEACPQCREELERLQLTEAALFTLREEEIPQRIAFVSDQIFEPSPWRRAFAAFWGSGPRLGFAAAAMLSVALIVSAVTRPAPAPVRTPAAQTLDTAEIERRVQAAADRAGREIEARYAVKTDQLVKAIERRNQDERKLMVASWEMQDSYQQHLIGGLRSEVRHASESAQAREVGDIR